MTGKQNAEASPDDGQRRKKRQSADTRDDHDGSTTERLFPRQDIINERKFNTNNRKTLAPSQLVKLAAYPVGEPCRNTFIEDFNAMRKYRKAVVQWHW
jgi:hypothetical protein